MRYDRVWSNLVNRAISQGGLDIQSFIDQAVELGMSEDAIQQRLLDDLESDGPIFGRFFRSLGGAAELSVNAAYNQGSKVGDIDGDRELKRLLGLRTNVNEFGSIIDVADPEAMQEIADAVAERDERMWVSELINTCFVCLPLHGTVRTMAEWDELGFDPSTIHQLQGWASKCHCKLVPSRQVDRTQEMRPLVRNKLPTHDKTAKTNKLTKRGVTQVDLDRSIAASQRALESETGRRTLRLLGQSRTLRIQSEREMTTRGRKREES